MEMYKKYAEYCRKEYENGSENPVSFEEWYEWKFIKN